MILAKASLSWGHSFIVLVLRLYCDYDRNLQYRPLFKNSIFGLFKFEPETAYFQYRICLAGIGEF